MFQKLLTLQGLLFLDVRNFSLVSVILFWIKTYTSTLIYRLCPIKEACQKRKHKKIYKEVKSEHSVFGKISFPVLFALGWGLITPYSLGVLIWNFFQAFLIVCIELWLRFVPQIRSTRFAMNFLFIIATIERKVSFCVKLFDHFRTEYSSIWAEICCVSSQIILGFFDKISTKNSFWKMLQKLLALQGAHLFRCPKFCPICCNFILSSYCTEKFQNHLTQVLSYVVCIQSRRYMEKRKHKKW